MSPVNLTVPNADKIVLRKSTGEISGARKFTSVRLEAWFCGEIVFSANIHSPCTTDMAPDIEIVYPVPEETPVQNEAPEERRSSRCLLVERL